jgi:prophage antirepressor-like protein
MTSSYTSAFHVCEVNRHGRVLRIVSDSPHGWAVARDLARKMCTDTERYAPVRASALEYIRSARG